MRRFFLLSSGKTRIKLVHRVFIILVQRNGKLICAISLFVVHMHSERGKERTEQSAIKNSKKLLNKKNWSFYAKDLN